jgi:hypothetical protein
LPDKPGFHGKPNAFQFGSLVQVLT